MLVRTLDSRLMDHKSQMFLLVSDTGRVETVRAVTERAAVAKLFLIGRWQLGEKIIAATEMSERA